MGQVYLLCVQRILNFVNVDFFIEDLLNFLFKVEVFFFKLLEVFGLFHVQLMVLNKSLNSFWDFRNWRIYIIILLPHFFFFIIFLNSEWIHSSSPFSDCDNFLPYLLTPILDLEPLSLFWVDFPFDFDDLLADFGKVSNLLLELIVDFGFAHWWGRKLLNLAC